MTTNSSGNLLLFDIDGTLLQKASREHAQAMFRAIEMVHGVDARNTRPAQSAAGRTDGEIARVLLLACGVPAEKITANAAAMEAECCRIYQDLCPADISDRVVPGMPDLLDALAARDDVTMALVSGNYEGVARRKLAAAGIGHHFAPHLGAFGSDSEVRDELPPIARVRAGAPAAPWSRSRTIVIGDTPRDITCARADELRVIAVTTGPHCARDLAGADAVVDDCDGLAKVLYSML